MSSLVVHLLLVGGVALVVSMVLAPLESLGWWAGWLGPADAPETPEPPPAVVPGDQPTAYVVFLSGIGSISGDALLPTESEFLDRLQAALPNTRIVRDVFPYAPSGRQLLTGQRVFSWFWRRVEAWRISGRHVLPALLNLRNLFQVMVSADHRYGPLYSFGIARVARERLEAHGFVPGSGVPVVLLGSSGGGQISVGAATYLGDEIGETLAIVTFGGVMCSDRGLDEVTRLFSLYGSDDRVYALGRMAFPGRWAMAAGSSWNTARREHRLEEREIGPMGHSGAGGYLDPRPQPGGEPYINITVREVAASVRAALAAPVPPSNRSINTG